MSEATAALRLFALADPDIVELVGDRIRPSSMHQADILPCVCVTTISSDPDESLLGDAGHQNDRIQFDVFAATDAGAHRLARLLRLRWLAAYGILETDIATVDDPDPPAISVTGVSTAGGIRDIPADAPIDGSDDWQYRSSFDLFVSFNPS